MHAMTNLSLIEFHDIYGRLQDHISKNYNCGRGKRSKYAAKDVFFMSLAVCKHSGQWEFLGKLFNIKGPTFERLVTSFLKMLADYAYDVYVDGAAEQFTMAEAIREKATFRTYGMARYATDVTFQQTNRLRGNIQESKAYFSEKHKLYGFKTEVSVLANGLAVGCSRHYTGSTADIDIFYQNLAWHKTQLRKSVDERIIPDVGPAADKYPRYWAVLMDKGYQGAAESIRAITPVKNPRACELSRHDEDTNKEIAGDRNIVGNYFSRQCTLWMVVSNKFRWSEGKYDPIFLFTLAMTNAHILKHPLCCAQRTRWTSLMHFEDSISAKRKC